MPEASGPGNLDIYQTRAQMVWSLVNTSQQSHAKNCDKIEYWTNLPIALQL